MKESVLRFDCEGQPLVGILAEPDGPPADTGVVIVVGGPQYRAGSHRQFTLLARHLATHGHATLRFDYRGMGDSAGDERGFLEATPDVRAAIDRLLAERPGLKRVVLWGLCDGASAALLYLDSTRDPRVKGLMLLNPWVRSEATLAQTHVKHYYWQRLRQRSFWTKLLSGNIGATALRSLANNLRLARGGAGQQPATSRSFQDRMAEALRSFDGATLLVLSGNDYTAREFADWVAASADRRALLNRASVTRHDLPSADHTLSTAADHTALCQLCASWLASRPFAPTASGDPMTHQPASPA